MNTKQSVSLYPADVRGITFNVIDDNAIVMNYPGNTASVFFHDGAFDLFLDIMHLTPNLQDIKKTQKAMIET